jgi:phosphoribosyl-ATP pyrophosphohydrolase/phosphoribosyl-AMP cyclohydrolase
MKGATFLGELKFGSDGLIPAIVQDADTSQVLMVAYMNREALERTWETGETWFYSRSRQELWHKGGTSGHTQKVRGISFDCDQDAILVKVEPIGAACHEGYTSCFFREITSEGEVQTIGQPVFDPKEVYNLELIATKKVVLASALDAVDKAVKAVIITSDSVDVKKENSSGTDIISELYQIILERQQTLPEGSYTAYLFNKGIDKICKKVGEEAAEVIIAAKNRSREELVYESADLIYHLLVLLAEAGINSDEVLQELIKRR